MENMKVQHKSETLELKKKLAATEKRLVQMWDYNQEQQRKQDAKMAEFQQLVVSVVSQQNTQNLQMQMSYQGYGAGQISTIPHSADQSGLDNPSKLYVVNMLQQNNNQMKVEQLFAAALEQDPTVANIMTQVKKAHLISTTFLQPNDVSLINKQLQTDPNTYSELSSSLISQSEQVVQSQRCLQTPQI